MKKVVADSFRHILRQPYSAATDFSVLSSPPPEPIDSKSAVFPPWGIDRLDRPYLPLDSSYVPAFTGKKPLFLFLSFSASTLLISIIYFYHSYLHITHSLFRFFSGIDVDVFVIDTGLDTTHSEFAHRPGEHVRTIKNLFDAYSEFPDRPSNNTDGEGHGTHVAGTAQCSTVLISTRFIFIWSK